MSDTRITELLDRAHKGEPGAMDRVVTLMYADLRARARMVMRAGAAGDGDALTLQPTALVSEAYLKLLRQRNSYADRRHFLAVASQIMLRVLIDYRRARGAGKRGGGQVRVTLSGIGSDDVDPAAQVSDVADALERLDSLDPRKADVVRLRVLWGLEMAEIASLLDVSRATIERDWRFAKSWLARELRDDAV